MTSSLDQNQSPSCKQPILTAHNSHKQNGKLSFEPVVQIFVAFNYYFIIAIFNKTQHKSLRQQRIQSFHRLILLDKILANSIHPSLSKGLKYMPLT